MALPKKSESKTTTAMSANYQDTFLGSERPPSFTGPQGSVWRVEYKPEAERVEPDIGAVLGMWFMHAKTPQPFNYYMVLLQHLREHDGLAPAIKVSKVAEYEVMIHLLHPEHPVPNIDAIERNDRPAGSEALVSLLSDESEIALQFRPIKGGDAAVVGAIDSALQQIVQSEHPLIEEYRLQWAQTISVSLLDADNASRVN